MFVGNVMLASRYVKQKAEETTNPEAETKVKQMEQQVQNLTQKVQELEQELQHERRLRLAREADAELYRNKYLIMRGCRPRPGADILLP
jgi:hypothetical protein